MRECTNKSLVNESSQVGLHLITKTNFKYFKIKIKNKKEAPETDDWRATTDSLVILVLYFINLMSLTSLINPQKN